MNAKTQRKEWSVWVSGAMARNFCKIVDAEQNIVAVVQNDPSGIVTQEDEANAELIVMAVNSFDDLLAAARHGADSIHHPACKAKGENIGFPERYCTCHVQKCRAAIQKAEASQREGE